MNADKTYISNVQKKEEVLDEELNINNGDDKQLSSSEMKIDLQEEQSEEKSGNREVEV